MRAKPPTKSSRPVRSAKVVNNKNTNPEKKRPSIQSSKIDSSLMFKSVDTSVSGLKQAIKLFESGTDEMCQLLSNECSLIYECNVCRNLFRSLANFVTHKRTYCPTKFNSAPSNNGKNDQVQEHTLLLGCTKGNTLTSRSTSRGDIISLLDNLVTKETRKDSKILHSYNDTVILKEMSTTSEGLVNYNKDMKEKSSVGRDTTATLGPDGRILGSSSTNESCVCSQCHQEFMSSKCLTVHLRTAHGNYRIRIVCPCCKKYFSSTSSVYRHLYSVHQKSIEQVRKLRTQIQKKKVSLEELSRSDTPTPTSSSGDSHNQDKAWMEELEGNSALTSCLWCGKKFDRRVALVSHLQSCITRKKLIKGEPGVPMPPPTTPSSQEPRRSGIEVRMFYEKDNIGTKLKHGATSLSSQSGSKTVIDPLSLTRCCVSLPKWPTPADMASYHVEKVEKSDKVVKDVVSRYLTDDTEMQNKCRRLEAKLLQLHRVAIEEVQGSVNEETVSESRIRECIGASSPGAEKEAGVSMKGVVGLEEREVRKRKREGEVGDREELEEDGDREIGQDGEREVEETGEREVEEDGDREGEEDGERGVEEDEEMLEDEDGPLPLLDNIKQEYFPLFTRSLSAEESPDSGFELIVISDDEEEEEVDDEEDECMIFSEGEESATGMGSRAESAFEESEEAASTDFKRLGMEVDESHGGDDKSSLVLSMVTEDIAPATCSPTRVESIVVEKRALSSPTLLINGNHPPSPSDIDTAPLPSHPVTTQLNMFMNRRKKRCLICQKVLPNLRSLIRHVAGHLKVFRYKCGVNSCDFKCFLRVDIAAHLEKQHKKTSLLVRNFIVPIESSWSGAVEESMNNTDILVDEAISCSMSPQQSEAEEISNRDDPGSSCSATESDSANDKIQALIAKVIFGSRNSETNGETPMSPVCEKETYLDSSEDEWDS